MLSRAVKYSYASRTYSIPLKPLMRPYSAASQDGRTNQDIIDMLELSKVQESMKSEPNKFKMASFARAVNVIKACERPITSPEDLRELQGKGIGPRISARILAHLSGESYNPDAHIPAKEKEPMEENYEPTHEDMRAMQILMTIPGIGKVKAMRLLKTGCRRIQQLLEPMFYDTLNRQQQLGVKYYDEISKPVAREEAEALEAFLRENLNSKWEVILVGSYRRGSPTSSDIDIILLHPSHVHIPVPDQKGTREKTDKTPSMLQQDVLEPLRRSGIIADTLTLGPLKWQGMVRIPQRDDGGEWESVQTRVDAVAALNGAFRRADFTLVPIKSKGAASLSLTGDLEFNKDLRKRAIQLGMHLNENGLWRFHPRNGNPHPPQESASELPTEEGHWQLVASKTEKSILTELGMPWVEPQKRNFNFLADSKARKSKEPKIKPQPKATSTPAAEVKVKRGRGRPRKT